MALTYLEFDTTNQNLIADLKAAILGSTDWAQVSGGAAITTTTAAAAVAATSVTVASNSAINAGVVVGSVIRIGSGATAEYKNVTAVAATSISFTSQGLAYAQPSGTQISWGQEVLKAVTTRGAQMVVDLTDSAPALNALNIAAYRSHDGTTGVDRIQRYLYWRSNTTGATPAMPLHCIVSASKEHLFISVEGPRANESQATSITLGSLRNYFLIGDVVPYHVEDTTPVVFCGGAMSNSQVASATANSHQGNFSRNMANSSSWSVAKLLALDFPSVASTETIQVTHQSTADGKWYLSPYVAFGDESGVRGRLANFFLAGYNYSDTPEIATPPIGSKITYAGQTYKLLAVNKGDGATYTWGQFGSAGNNTAATFYRSVVVAIPCTP